VPVVERYGGNVENGGSLMIKIEEFKEEQVIIRLEGNMTSSHAALIRNELFQLVERGNLFLTFKMNKVTKVNSSFIGLLVAVQQKAAEKGGTVTMIGLNEKVNHLLKRANALRFFTIVQK
jgi:anti-anti-sigma factor